MRRIEVERLCLLGYSIEEIAEKMGVDSRTINRDIQANREERLKMLGSSADARKWLQEQLADAIGFFDFAKKKFCRQADTFKTEAAKSRSLWYAVELESKKIETIKSLIWSVYDLEVGGHQLKYEEEE